MTATVMTHSRRRLRRSRRLPGVLALALLAAAGCTSHGPPSPTVTSTGQAVGSATRSTADSSASSTRTPDPEPLSDLNLPLSGWAPGKPIGTQTVEGTLVLEHDCVLLRRADASLITLIWPKNSGGSYVPSSGYGYIFTGSARLVIGDHVKLVGSVPGKVDTSSNTCLRGHQAAVFTITENLRQP